MIMKNNVFNISQQCKENDLHVIPRCESNLTN